jgi:hypothetical protein
VKCALLRLRRYKESGCFVQSIAVAIGFGRGRHLAEKCISGEPVEQKREEMERNELDAAQHASRLGNILGFATVASHSQIAENAFRFTRKGSAIVFDQVAQRLGRLDLVERFAFALIST